MKKFYGHIYVCEDDANFTENLIIENDGEVVHGFMKWLVGLVADANLSPLYRRMLRSISSKIVVFRCDTISNVEHILMEDIKTFGGYRVM